MSDEPASPVCYASEAGDVYMGYATREEIIVALNELLEAERAGARVTRVHANGPSDPAMSELLKTVHVDEARWCAMLSGAIKRLGGTPSRRCGAFYAKTMAIADPVERLAFLNRGQAWVVRKLDALTPRLRDDELHGALRDMAKSHVTNIALTDGVIAAMHLGSAGRKPDQR